MTRHETIERINHRLEHLDTERLQQFLKELESETLEFEVENPDGHGEILSLDFQPRITPGDGGKIGKRKPVPMTGSKGSEHIIREARDSREKAL